MDCSLVFGDDSGEPKAPLVGRKEPFCGAIGTGRFQVTTSASPTTLQAGDQVLLTVRIQSMGRWLRAPDRPDLIHKPEYSRIRQSFICDYLFPAGNHPRGKGIHDDFRSCHSIASDHSGKGGGERNSRKERGCASTGSPLQDQPGSGRFAERRACFSPNLANCHPDNWPGGFDPEPIRLVESSKSGRCSA